MKRPKQPRRSRGRPLESTIPDRPENILKAVPTGPPKNDWKYLREQTVRK